MDAYTILPLSRGELIRHNLFLICLFFYHPVSHEMCANGIPCTCFTLAFGLMVLGFTNAN